MTYDQMIDKLKKNEPFAFSRWGDGEWYCLLGCKGENCDGHEYFTSLGLALQKVLLSRPKYVLGMQPKAQVTLGKEINTYLKRNKLDNLNWCDADVLHNASIENRLDDMMNLLLDRDTVLLGNWRLGTTAFELIKIPCQNAWLTYRSTLAVLKQRVCPGSVVLFSAGMMSKVLIDDLWHHTEGQVTLIDAGSVFEPYVGYRSRKYHELIMKREKNSC